MASKLWVHEPDTFFLQGDTEISGKRNFFVNRSVPENFQREIFSGQAPTESLCTQDSEYVYERGVEFLTLFCPKLGDAGRTRAASKNRAVLESQILPQLSEFSLAIESTVFHKYQNTADSRTRLNFDNCGRICVSNTV